MLKCLSDKVADLHVCSFIKKETETQVFSCEYGEIFKKTFFEEHLQTTAPKHRNSYLSRLIYIPGLTIICSNLN